ncbi:hypothetical protein ACLMJK_008622 [Lecanora helva]
MPPTPVSHRPQTLKQAKKAYRKSGATVRLSTSELAMIERRAVLQERADRIREREARRKANIRRREERNQKEREERQRMGIPSPVKGGIHNGPSQLSLGKFVEVGEKRRSEDEWIEHEQAREEEEAKSGLNAVQIPPLRRIPWRNPLMIISPNSRTPKTLPLGAVKSDRVEASDLKATPKAPPPRPPTTENPTPILSKHGNKQSSQSQSKTTSTPQQDHSKLLNPPTTLMLPPPLRASLDTQPTTSKPISKPLHLVKQNNPPPQLAPIDDAWDDFFASSTQIARELSPPPAKFAQVLSPFTTQPTLSPPPPPPPQPPSHHHPLPQKPNDDSTKTLLSHLSTQDLDFPNSLTQIPPPPAPARTITPPRTDELLDQISTQDLDFSPEVTQIPSPTPPSPQAQSPSLQAQLPPADSCSSSSSFSEDITASDLEYAVQEFERDSATPTNFNSSMSIVPNHRRSPILKSMIVGVEDENFDLSTQEWRELTS